MITVLSVDPAANEPHGPFTLERFAKPESEENPVFSFNITDRLGSFRAFIVEIVSLVKATGELKFHAIHPETRESTRETYTLSLTELDHGWTRPPSSIEIDVPFDPRDESKKCALLFLRDAWVEEQDKKNGNTHLKDARPTTKGPCPKWPCTSSGLTELRLEKAVLEAEIAKLREQHAELKNQWTALRTAFMTIAANIDSKLTEEAV